MEDGSRYGVLAVTVVAVLVFGIGAVLTRNSWTDAGRADVTDLAANRTPPTFATSVPTSMATTTSVATPTTVRAVAPPVPAPAKSAKPVIPPIPKPGGGPPVPGPGASTTSSSMPPPPPGPTGGEQRSGNDVSFNYGPNPQDRTSGVAKPTAERGPLTFSIDIALEGDLWRVSADVVDSSSKPVTFEGGIDVVVHAVCNGRTDDFHLHNAEVTSFAPREGRHFSYGPIRPSDPGPGTCNAFGTVKYSGG